MQGEYYYYKRSCHGHVPAFGSWDWNNDLPFTQCFESARQAGLLRYSFDSQERDLYVAGDLYDNDIVTPAMIVVPRQTVSIYLTITYPSCFFILFLYLYECVCVCNFSYY